MIISCMEDMKIFMAILIVGVFAFADAFFSIDKIIELRAIGGDEGGVEVVVEAVESPDLSNYEKYWQPYVFAWQKSFLTALGEFDGNLVDGNYREGDWLVFFLCCIFNIILLLNLLIAIISETFANISESSVEFGFKEKTKQMAVMQNSIFGIRGNDPDPNEFLFIAKVIGSEEMKTEDEVADQIQNLSDKVDIIKDEMKDHIKTIIDEMGETLADKLGVSDKEKKA